MTDSVVADVSTPTQVVHLPAAGISLDRVGFFVTMPQPPNPPSAEPQVFASLHSVRPEIIADPKPAPPKKLYPPPAWTWKDVAIIPVAAVACVLAPIYLVLAFVLPTLFAGALLFVLGYAALRVALVIAVLLPGWVYLVAGCFLAMGLWGLFNDPETNK